MVGSGEMGLLSVFLIMFFLSLLGVVLAKTVRLPGVVGVLLVGVGVRFSVDVFGFGFINGDIFDELAKFGVAFLLFLLGIEFSLSNWNRWRWMLVGMAVGQIVLTVVLGYLSVLVLGINGVAAWVMALGLSLSSTAVVVKILIDKREVQTLSGQILILWLLIQDIAVVPMFLFFSFYQLVGGGGFNWLGILMVMMAVVLIWFGLKAVFDFLARKWGREVLVLAAAILGLGLGMMFESVGLSLPLGAFIAGVMVSRANEKHEVLTRMSVLRDLFAGVFFLSLGYMVSLGVVVREWRMILSLVLVFGLLKMVIAGVGLRLARVHRRVAIPVIVGLFDAGEFTLILAQEGWRRGLVEVRYLSILTGVVVLSMLMLPLLSIFENIFEKFLGFLGWGKETKMFGLGNGEEVFAGGVIVFGGGRTGRLVCEWLKQKHRKAVVVDYDLRVIERLVEKGVRAVYGNAVDEETIDFLNIDRAKGVVVTVPEGRVTAEIIKKVRSRNNKVNLVVRAHSRNEATWFKELGANRVILAEESVGRLMCSYLKLGR